MLDYEQREYTDYKSELAFNKKNLDNEALFFQLKNWNNESE